MSKGDNVDHLAEARRMAAKVEGGYSAGEVALCTRIALDKLADAIEELRSAPAVAVAATECGDRMAGLHDRVFICEKPSGHAGKHESEEGVEWWRTPVATQSAVEQLYECSQPTCGCRQDDRYKPLPELEGATDRFEREDKEAEDRAKAEQDAMAAALERDISNAAGITWGAVSTAEIAHKLVAELGWRKGGSDE